ncbi:MAG: actin-related protein [Monoraphidium minutum]|nr:MAG: actin-related protein [Monoraphidium minutum]
MASDAEKLGRTVVIDYGSSAIKAGRARDVPSENALSCITPSVVEVRPPGSDAAAACAPGGGPWPRSEVVRRGRVFDIDQFEALLHHVLYDRMGWRHGREDALVVVEPVLASRAEREAIAQLAFEAFGVRGYFVCDAAACSLYTCNKQAGLSVDVGHGKAVVAAVAEGATHAASAAAAADKQQQQDPRGHEAAWRAARRAFTLPDGQTLELAGDEGYRLGEALVRPATAGLAAPALAELCCDVVGRVPEPAARRGVWDAVLVCGGGGTMPGLKERLLDELPLFAPPSASFGAAALPNYLPPDARAHAAWVGGAVLSRVALHQMVTPNEYSEYGPAVINRII